MSYLGHPYLQDKGTNITMANLIGAAEQDVHAVSLNLPTVTMTLR